MDDGGYGGGDGGGDGGGGDYTRTDWTFGDGDDDFAGGASSGKGGFAGATKDALIIAIDARPNMFVPRASPAAHASSAAASTTAPSSATYNPPHDFALAMRVVRLTLRRKVMSGGRDLVGVIFFGSPNKHNRNDFQSIFELMPLQEPTSESVSLAYRWSLPSDVSADEIRATIGAPATAPATAARTSAQDSLDAVEHALWYCQLAFAERKLKDSDTQRVWVISNDPDPSKSALPRDSLRKVFQRASDLGEGNRVITMWPLTPEERFPVDPFWMGLMTAHVEARRRAQRKALVDAGDEEGLEMQNLTSVDEDVAQRFAFQSSAEELADIFETVRKTENAKRRLASFPLVLGSGVELGTCLLYTSDAADD